MNSHAEAIIPVVYQSDGSVTEIMTAQTKVMSWNVNIVPPSSHVHPESLRVKETIAASTVHGDAMVTKTVSMAVTRKTAIRPPVLAASFSVTMDTVLQAQCNVMAFLNVKTDQTRKIVVS